MVTHTNDDVVMIYQVSSDSRNHVEELQNELNGMSNIEC